jgi:hypothetical protein
MEMMDKQTLLMVEDLEDQSLLQLINYKDHHYYKLMEASNYLDKEVVVQEVELNFTISVGMTLLSTRRIYK